MCSNGCLTPDHPFRIRYCLALDRSAPVPDPDQSASNPIGSRSPIRRMVSSLYASALQPTISNTCVRYLDPALEGHAGTLCGG